MIVTVSKTATLVDASLTWSTAWKPQSLPPCTVKVIKTATIKAAIRWVRTTFAFIFILQFASHCGCDGVNVVLSVPDCTRYATNCVAVAFAARNGG